MRYTMIAALLLLAGCTASGGVAPAPAYQQAQPQQSNYGFPNWGQQAPPQQPQPHNAFPGTTPLFNHY